MMLLASREPEHVVEWVVAVMIAMTITLALLVYAERIAKLFGQHVLIAFQRLMGLVLTAIAVEMFLNGI